MPKFFNLHYISNVADYEKGQGIPHHKNFATIQPGTIISYNESDTADQPSDRSVPFGVGVLTVPADQPNSHYHHTMKADGASELNKHPLFLDPGTHMITKKVDLETMTLVDNGLVMPPISGALKFTNPDMTPQRRS